MVKSKQIKGEPDRPNSVLAGSVYSSWNSLEVEDASLDFAVAVPCTLRVFLHGLGAQQKSGEL